MKMIASLTTMIVTIIDFKALSGKSLVLFDSFV